MLLISVILYFVITLLLGVYANKKISSSADFINTGRNLHPAINTAALFALWFGSETIFGASSEFAEKGLPGIVEDPLGGVMCLLLVSFFYARRLYNLNMLTIGDLFRIRYGKTIEMMASAMMIFSFFGYAAAQLVALGLLLQVLTGMSLTLGIVISASIVCLYTLSGGMWAVSLTDFVQSILIVTGLVAMTIYLTQMAGGTSVILNSLPSEHRQILPKDSGISSWINWVAAWMVLGFGSIASQDIFQRLNSARNADAAVSSTFWGGVIYFIMAMLPLYLILGVKLLFPHLLEGDLQTALPKMVMESMPLWLQILFFGSLFSAIMSTCSGAILAPASLLSENLIKELWKKSIDDRAFLQMTRWSVVIIGIISVWVATLKQNIFELVAMSSIIGLVSIFVPFHTALWSKEVSRTGAICSMIMGLATWAVFEFILLSDIHPLIYGFMVSLAAYYAGAKAERHFIKAI